MDNNGIPAAKDVLSSGLMNRTSPDEPCGDGENASLVASLSEAGKLYSKPHGKPCPLDTATLENILDVQTVEKKAFDPDKYLRSSNAKERQHRLLCKLEAKQQEAEGVTNSSLIAKLKR